jgi:CubicO group peptidase (beta-lactamase class C family)
MRRPIAVARAARAALAGLVAATGPALVAVPTARPAAAEAPAGPAVSARLQAVVASWASANQVPGISVTVQAAGRGTWSATWGTTTPTFDVNSITKTFTAALVLRAADQGLLSLDAPVGPLAAVPSFPYTAFTPRQLLAHRTGLANYRDTPQFQAGQVTTPQQALAAVGTQPLVALPPSGASYSSSNFLVLGFVLEQATGRSYDDLLAGLLGEVGLTATTHLPPAPGDPNFSTSGIVTTTADLAAWGQALLIDDRLGLGPGALAALTTPDLASGMTQGLWTYCPCPSADGRPVTAFGLGGNHSELQVDPAGRTAVAVDLPGSSLWLPAGRYDAVHALVQQLRDVVATAMPAAGSTTVVHTGRPDTTLVTTLTATDATAPGYVVAYPCAAGQPPTSNLNVTTGQTIATTVLLTTDHAGDVCLTTWSATHLLLDDTATLATTAITPHPGTRLLDTRTLAW